MFAPIERVVAWLREGYPQGIPTRDYIPLVALLRRRLSDDEITMVGRRLEESGMLRVDESHVGAEFMRLTDEIPAPDEVHRVSDRLREAGLDIAQPAWERQDAPVVHLLYGLAGSGKSALARAIEEEEETLRFSLDEWMARLYPEADPASPQYGARVAAVRALIRDIALQALHAGVDVVLDWNAWSRARRDWAVELADEAGATVILHHLTAGLEEASARLAGRPQAGGARARRVSRAGNEHLASIMEPVGPDERIRVIRH